MTETTESYELFELGFPSQVSRLSTEAPSGKLLERPTHTPTLLEAPYEPQPVLPGHWSGSGLCDVSYPDIPYLVAPLQRGAGPVFVGTGGPNTNFSLFR